MLTPALAQSLLVLGITPGMLLGRGLQPHPEASTLTLAETGADGREYLLEPQAAAAWQAMKAAAAKDGVALHLVSAFRSVGRQTVAHGFWLSYPRGNAAGYGYEPWHWCFQGPASAG